MRAETGFCAVITKAGFLIAATCFRGVLEIKKVLCNSSI